MSAKPQDKTSLIVKVHFSPESPNRKFAYEMDHGDHGWAVDRNGNIEPPPAKKVIRFDLHSDADARIHGLRFALREKDFPRDPGADPWFNQSRLQAFVPMVENVKRSVTFVLDHQLTGLFYALGVECSGEIVWDDPRIYSDGSI